MNIKLKIKTKEEVSSIIRETREDTGYGSSFWVVQQLTSNFRHVVDITEDISYLYTKFENVPNEIRVRGFIIQKRFLDWEEPEETKGVEIIPIGLTRLK